MAKKTLEPAHHSLVFVGGRTREIAKIYDYDRDGRAKTDKEIRSEAMLHIRAFAAERNFKIYYVRIWNKDGVTVFDVGSHTEFFHLIPEVNW
ncbi:hypothetical protein [Flavonifractor sp. An4]|jgi:hypothetical protein|uniref:hypothetical protein n=1 Tax=Flavonifractor sp. An4 TaxID=1965634 RepID=UPI000B397CC9|nr:hypothetical protein [Flavonifractor sp. An4]OUO16205.1 hypothetical protein B5F94_06045 [Flavonifractor sp. An4]